MSGYAPQWALSAQAIDSAGDSHLSKGVHIRAIPGQVLGLPIFPFKVYRINLGQPSKSTMMRTDGIRWVDSKGVELTPPFAISAGNPVTAFLPPPSQAACCWIEILADVTGGSIRTDAIVSSYNGLTTVCTCTKPAFQMNASRIDRVLIQGTGQVRGARWVDAVQLDRYETGLWRMWSLPVTPGQRYTPTATADADATDRVRRGGPLRVPMFYAPTVPDPMSAPAIPNPPDSEKLRVESGNAAAANWLKHLINDLSAPPPQLIEHITNPSQPITFDFPMMNGVWLSSLDPGMAKWFGFSDVDTDQVGSPGDVIAYMIKGIWQQNLGSLTDPDLLNAIPAAGKVASISALNSVKKLNLANPPQTKEPFFDLFAVACVTLGNPYQRPQPPVVESFDYKPFLPAKPPTARREIGLNLAGLAIGPGAALARNDGGGYVSINPKKKDVIKPLLVSGKAGKGKVFDRNAPADAVTYRLAQSDLFGRWSDWSKFQANAAKRPLPPKPVVQAFYTPPGEEFWDQPGPLSGLFTIVIPVPPNESLAPGSYPLDSVFVQVGAQSATALASAQNAQGNLILKVTGPGLMPCASTTVSIKAHWIASNTSGPDSDEIKKKIFDPRPPEPVSMNYALAYSSRPDATGKSRVDLQWQTAAAQMSYRVYYTSETILMSKLSAANPSLLEKLETMQDLAQRAQFLKDNSPSFPREWFELLTKEPMDKAGAPSMRFVHEVSGSLTTLGFYRVASISEANVEGPFGKTTMVAYAVPNTDPPAMPLLEVKVDAAMHATVNIKVPRGGSEAIAYRLRRTTGTPSDASRMRVIATGSVPAPADSGAQLATYVDNDLKPWKRYFWRAEVKGANLPGSTLAGDWSKPSAAVEALVIPSTPPNPVTNPNLKVDSGSVTIVFSHNPEQLKGGSVGHFRIEIYKQVHPSLTKETLLVSLIADQPGLFSQQGIASYLDAEAPIPGTAYRIVVFDPLGRASAPSNPLIVPEVN